MGKEAAGRRGGGTAGVPEPPLDLLAALLVEELDGGGDREPKSDPIPVASLQLGHGLEEGGGRGDAEVEVDQQGALGYYARQVLRVGVWRGCGARACL